MRDLDSTYKAPKLPRSIPFPGGHVPVRVITDEKMIEVAGESVDGFWQVANRTIYINKSLSPWAREEVFFHELHHAVTDMEWEGRIRRNEGCGFTSQVPIPEETLSSIPEMP